MSESPDDPGPDEGEPPPDPAARSGLPARPHQAVPRPLGERVRGSGIVIHLPLRGRHDSGSDGPDEVRISFEIPVLGILAVAFGAIGLFQAPIVLAPLAILCGGAAVWRRQPGLGLLGIGLATAGLATSTLFWSLIGLSWLWTRLF